MDRKLIRIILLIASFVMLVLITSCDRGDKVSSDEPEAGTMIEMGEQSQAQDTDLETDAKDGQASEQKKGDEKEAPKESKTPLKSFQYSWTGSDNMPDIVIIVDDFGNSTTLLEDFGKLPQEVVFAVLPDLGATKRSGEVGAQYGHEVIIHFPMYAGPKNNVGTRYVKMDSSSEEIAGLIRDFKSQLPMAIGANNHMGSTATADRNVMEKVLKELHAQGLFFVDSMTIGSAVTPALARTLGYPALKRDMFLDVDDKHKPNSEASINAKIEYLGRYKGRKEPVIIITHCHNREKLNALQEFITKIKAQGLKLTTLSAAKRLAS